MVYVNSLACCVQCAYALEIHKLSNSRVIFGVASIESTLTNMPRSITPPLSDIDGPAEQPGDRKQRMREALLPPISSRVSALGGLEEAQLQDGSIAKTYMLGDQCLGC